MSLLAYVATRDIGLLDLRRREVDSRIAFTRASTRTYFDKAGVMQTAANDVWPREYDPYTHECLGRGIFDQMTNVLSYSEDFTTGWTATSATFAAGPTSPDAVTTTTTITSTGGSARASLATAGLTAATNYTFSVHVEAGTVGFAYLCISATNAFTNSVRAWFDLATGALGGTNVAGAGWTYVSHRVQRISASVWRCELTVNIGGTTAYAWIGPTPALATSNSVAGDSIHAWGAQLQVGDYALPYVKTTGVAASTASDTPSVVPSSVEYLDATNTIYVEGTLQGLVSRRFVSVGTSLTNRLSLGVSGIGELFYAMTDTGVDQAVLNPPFGAATVNRGVLYRFAACTAVNDFRACANGGAVVSDTSGTIYTGPATAIYLGRLPTGGGNRLNGWLRTARFWPRVLTNAELQKMTS